ncbi:MAG: DUF559 domain-containing protein [Acidimicrobiia bacterium]
MGVAAATAGLMGQQDGVISRRQATDLGASGGFIRARLENQSWIEMSSGVYASVSSPPTWERKLRAAVLGHPSSYVAGTSAGFLHEFDEVRHSRPEVMVPYGGNNRSPIARVIRAKHFAEVGTTEIRGFTCTSVAETILTLSMRLPPTTIARHIDNQLAARKLLVADFQPILDRLEFARQRGLRPLRRIVEARADDAYQPPTTELEQLLYRLLDRPELPGYERQLPIAYPTLTATVDAYIRDWSLIVEGDGRRWHTREEDYERDRRRDNAALAAGLAVVRLTWSMLRYQPEDCLRTLLDIGRHRSVSR